MPHKKGAKKKVRKGRYHRSYSWRRKKRERRALFEAGKGGEKKGKMGKKEIHSLFDCRAMY